jgi:hypothetical protein
MRLAFSRDAPKRAAKEGLETGLLETGLLEIGLSGR